MPLSILLCPAHPKNKPLPLRRIKSHAHTNARDRKPFVHMLSLQGIGFRICNSGP